MALHPTKQKVELRTTCSCVIALVSNIPYSLQCFDTVGWAAGRVSGL